ncbi:hypothetical protein [Mucilaginibacter sp.]|uniref:hypothetical protein n=1 Tax=Mucilaginibacter sp. TaxID=1882438 RepID=UPI0035BC6DD4
MDNIAFLVVLEGLLYYRTYYRNVRNIYGDGFNETLAGSMLKRVEKDIDDALEEIDLWGFY